MRIFAGEKKETKTAIYTFRKVKRRLKGTVVNQASNAGKKETVYFQYFSNIINPDSLEI